MPYRILLEPWAERARVLGMGHSHYEETETEIRGLAGDARFRPGWGVLVDTRELDYVPSLEDARRFAELFRELKEHFTGCIAVVVEGTARFGVAQMLAMLLENRGVQMGAFKDAQAAESWLAEMRDRLSREESAD